MEPTVTDISKGKQTALRICAAGVTLFARHGYAAVPMRAIANAAGIGAGAIYNHFSSKQEILRTILATHMETLLKACSDELAKLPNQTPHARLFAFVDFHLRYHHDKSNEVFLSYMELRNLEAQNHKQISAYRDKYEDILFTILNHGKEKELFTIADTHVSTKAIIGMLASLSNWYQSGGRLALRELVEIYWRLVGRMVGLKIDEVEECLCNQ